MKREEERICPQSKSPVSEPHTSENGSKKESTDSSDTRTNIPPRRFISSILGGDIPYGSSHHRHHILTSAERKEYLPLEKPEPSPSPPPHQPRCHPVSVIQRTPIVPLVKPKEETEMVIQEPEQDAPIDYHIPKKELEIKDLEDQKRKQIAIAIKRSQFLLAAGRKLSPSGMILMAAAGHTRNGGGGGGSRNHQGNASSGGSQGSSSSHSFGSSGGGGLSSSSAGGAVGGGSGGGGGLNPGGNGKSNYGPSSPPTGSLPPFYESLKGGGYPHQYGSQYQSVLSTTPLPMDVDTGQDLGFPPGVELLPKQYSLLQNVCAQYGLSVKDDEELTNMMKDSGAFLAYDDVMVDAMTGAVVDPLQFTATLTLGPDHSALLDSLSDAAELFLREVPSLNKHQSLSILKQYQQ